MIINAKKALNKIQCPFTTEATPSKGTEGTHPNTTNPSMTNL